jgi:hypothetical protein
MSLPQGGFAQDRRSGRRRALIVAGIIFAGLIAWTYAVMSYGGGGAQDGAQDGAAAPREGNEAAQASTHEAGQNSSAHASAPNDGSEAEGALSAEGATGNSESAPASAPVSAPSSTPAAAPSGGGGGSSGDSYDPLGRGASPGDLTKVDQERARFAAAQFVTAAYGYSGSDKDAYNQGVGDTVVWPGFYQSEGSKEIERYASQVERTGTKSAAKVTRLKLQQTSPYSASGYAYFETGAGYGASGNLTGERRAYRQHITLQRTDAAWSVKATGPIQEV